MYSHPNADYSKVYCKVLRDRSRRLGFFYGAIYGTCFGVVVGYLFKTIGG